LNQGKNETAEAEMSLINDYSFHTQYVQQRMELMARATEDGLARGIRADSAPWWRRMVRRVVRRGTATTRVVKGGLPAHGHSAAR
jgi:hypothetical protein